MKSHDGKIDEGRSLAVVTGASSGIGFYLAKECAENGYDLLVAADSTELEQAAEELRTLGVNVETVETDLANTEGVEELYEATKGRPVDILMANAGHGLGHAFLDQEFEEARHVIDTNVTGTV
jgi:short-subunit dehydrogenase